MDYGEDYRTIKEMKRKSGKTVRKQCRDYKCPKCKGEFNKWAKEMTPTRKVCPFCNLTKGSYNPEGDTDE